MKLQTVKSASLSQRCSHHDTNGRQCRSLASDSRSRLCPQHRAEQKQDHSSDHFVHLIRNFQCFQTAQGINHSLGNLYELLAKNRISPRRAAVLSYISSLLLRTLPQIDADRAAGIIDPTKPRTKLPTQPLAVPVPDEATGPNSGSDPVPDSVNAWNPSIPEPDPKKKPS
jgi:hypothetical protein